MPVLIPIPRENLEALEKALYRVAPFDWVARRSIHIFPLDGPTQENAADAICEYCQDNKIQHVLVPKRVHCGEKTISRLGTSL